MATPGEVAPETAFRLCRRSPDEDCSSTHRPQPRRSLAARSRRRSPCGSTTTWLSPARRLPEQTSTPRPPEHRTDDAMSPAAQQRSRNPIAAGRHRPHPRAAQALCHDSQLLVFRPTTTPAGLHNFQPRHFRSAFKASHKGCLLAHPSDVTRRPSAAFNYPHFVDRAEKCTSCCMRGIGRDSLSGTEWQRTGTNGRSS